MGVKTLARIYGGNNVRVAILDSGTPPPIFNNEGRVLSIYDHYDSEDDVYGHATAIGSILFGGDGIRGLCERAEPVYIKVLDSKGIGSIKSVSNGILRAIDEDCDVINLSLGFMRTEKCPKMLEKACERACEAGKIIFCASGNDGERVNWPAALKTTICVGATDKNGAKTSFSSTGEVDFVAQGVNLPVFDIKGRLKTVSGTSFATALVSGVAALLVSRMKASGINVTIERVREALQSRAKDIDEPGWDENTGFGEISGENGDAVCGMKIDRGFLGKICAYLSHLKAKISKE